MKIMCLCTYIPCGKANPLGDHYGDTVIGHGHQAMEVYTLSGKNAALGSHITMRSHIPQHAGISAAVAQTHTCL